MLFHNHPTRRQNMEVSILIAIGLLFFAYKTEHWEFVIFSGSVLLLGLIFPLVFYPVAYVWFGLAKILGFVSSQLLLIFLFFVLIMPVGLVRRWMGKDSLQLKNFKKGHNSVLVSRDEKVLPAHLKNPF